MGSTVTYIDLTSNKRNEITLVYPSEANLDEMKISVLSPVGCALLGLKTNCTIDWAMPNKKYAKFKVESVQQNPVE
jgi:regulator of nucleoside diphosphate kinase